MIVCNIGLLTGIDPDCTSGALRGQRMQTIGMLRDAWLHIEGGRFHSWGPMSEFPTTDGGEEIIDAKGGAVVPSFCDSHTHLVYAGSREQEFVDKINGLSYEEIARRGGGILNSADRLRQVSETELYEQSLERAREVMDKGTGALEIKSGYGLDTHSELKMLRVIARIAEELPIHIKATWLGAHAVGREYAGRQEEYVDMLITDMLPAVAAEGLAEFVDVFCDRGFFTPEQTDRILEASAHYGLRPKIHGNELANSGGVQIAVSHSALSVDHLERIEQEEVELLAGSDTIATLLPGASFFLNMPYGPARRLIESGAAIALASDYNPGSSPSGDMRMVMSLGCIKMRLTPEEAFNAVTINGAAAMDSADSLGSIAKGKIANFFITDPIPSLAFIPYAYTTPLIAKIFVNGIPLQ
ncbi:MAG: imidazolonepropionase [Bacteroides sp.]|nr:imidazolonepropionase [Bacteroides sp.]MCM1412820.1 imidazolonepropionase [Bacteroides sp.]MCM1471489.1 imidazolonepropionase [Bacteroides sp.]